MRTVKEYIKDETLLNIIDKYIKTFAESDCDSASEVLKTSIQNTEKSEMIIPVLGMQGMGKSTLINGLLRENILPNEADETTCVPVEVKYGEEEHAEVYFEGNKPNCIVYTNDELASYVDNVHNPGNQKNVSRIVLYRKNDLLKNGLIIVDLPGVGSMTIRNHDTTTRYIKNLCTAIFVIPTTPTIRKQETIFIKSVWSQFGNAMFVQNLWDETEKELKESVEYNTLILKNIAKEINVSLDHDIIVVNAYDAVKGALEQNKTLVQSSNINTLRNYIEVFSKTWTEEMNNSANKRLISVLMSVINVIRKKLSEIGIEKEELIKQNKEEYEVVRKETKKINHKIDQFQDYLYDARIQLIKFVENIARKCSTIISSNINIIVDSGVTDGEMLKTAFANIQEDAINDAFNEVLDELMNVKEEVQDRFADLEEIVLNSDNKIQGVQFDKESQFKFEKALDPIGSITGGLTGLYFGGVISTVITGALEGGKIGSIAGPIGTVVGVVSGIIIAVGISSISNFAKKQVKKKRANETKAELRKVISEIEQTFITSMTKEVSETLSNIENHLQKLKEDRKAIERELKKNINNVENIADYAEYEFGLKKDMKYVETILEDMK